MWLGVPLFTCPPGPRLSGVVLSRSDQMARIRGRHTGPERLLRKLLWGAGLRYRIHAQTPVGRPDIVFPGSRVAVFVDGCFWHGCPDHYVRPRSSGAFWSAKLVENVNRDAAQTLRLEALGWRVCRLWEHDVFVNPDFALRQVVGAVQDARWRPPVSWRVSCVDVTDRHPDRECWHLRDLRDSSRLRTVFRVRTTSKWKDRRLERSMRLPRSRSGEDAKASAGRAGRPRARGSHLREPRERNGDGPSCPRGARRHRLAKRLCCAAATAADRLRLIPSSPSRARIL